MADLTLRVEIEDQELFDRTVQEYCESLERGTMSQEEAEADIVALALGMLKLVAD